MLSELSREWHGDGVTVWDEIPFETEFSNRLVLLLNNLDTLHTTGEFRLVLVKFLYLWELARLWVGDVDTVRLDELLTLFDERLETLGVCRHVLDRHERTVVSVLEVLELTLDLRHTDEFAEDELPIVATHEVDTERVAWHFDDF